MMVEQFSSVVFITFVRSLSGNNKNRKSLSLQTFLGDKDKFNTNIS